MKRFKFPVLRKKSDESELIHIKVDGTPQMIHESTRSITSKLFLSPTPENPHIGICHTCGYKNQFLSILNDLDNPKSCFSLNHDIESLAGMMSADELNAWGEGVEKAAYNAGEMSL